jgi:hypothetical protein
MSVVVIDLTFFNSFNTQIYISSPSLRSPSPFKRPKSFNMGVRTTSPSSTILRQSNAPLLSILVPAFTHSVWLANIFQRLLSTTTLFLFFRTYLLSLALLRQTYLATQILLLQSYWASKILAVQGYTASRVVGKSAVWTTKKSLHMGWNNKATKALRKKLVFEFYVFLLATGNPLMLIVFWPGWIVVLGGYWGVRWVVG